MYRVASGGGDDDGDGGFVGFGEGGDEGGGGFVGDELQLQWSRRVSVDEKEEEGDDANGLVLSQERAV